MSIAVTELLEGKGQYIRFGGDVTGTDVVAYNNEFLQHPEKLHDLLFVVASFEEANALVISEQESQVLGVQYSMMSEFAQQGSAIALVAPSDRLFALACIWEERITSECFQVATFRDFEDAEVWVTQKLRENFGVEVEGCLLGTYLSAEK
jgi:hypothetical protein